MVTSQYSLRSSRKRYRLVGVYKLGKEACQTVCPDNSCWWMLWTISRSSPTNTFCHLKEDIILIQAHVHSTAPEMDYFPWCMALKVIILRSTQRLFSLPIRICGTNWMNPHLIIDLKRRRWPWGAIGRVGGKKGGGLTHGDTWPLIWAAQSGRSADAPEAHFFGEWNVITR